MTSWMEMTIVLMAITLGYQACDYVLKNKSRNSFMLTLAVPLLIFLADTGHRYQIEGLVYIALGSYVFGFLCRFMPVPDAEKNARRSGIFVLLIFMGLTIHSQIFTFGVIPCFIFLVQMLFMPALITIIALIVNKFKPELVKDHMLISGVLLMLITVFGKITPTTIQLFDLSGSDPLGVKLSMTWGLIVCVLICCLAAYMGYRSNQEGSVSPIALILLCGTITFLSMLGWGFMFIAQTTQASIGPMGGSYAMLDQSNWVHICVLFGMSGFIIGAFVQGKPKRVRP